MLIKKIMNNSKESLNVWNELMQQLSTNEKCHEIIRMSPLAFARLCELLRETGCIQDNRNAIVEEQVAKFLYILAHNVKNRTISFFFHPYGETISRHFHEVVRAIISLEDQFVRQPNGVDVQKQIASRNIFYPYFKDCVGVIDETHVHVKVSKYDAPRYRGRKEYTTQNVMAACGFDIRFTYVLAGWEGTASDSRVIKNALVRDDNLVILNGKVYYLCLMSSFQLRMNVKLKLLDSCVQENIICLMWDICYEVD
ncbi:hypothetical protein UlMin_011787 [Ulmus minor]